MIPRQDYSNIPLQQKGMHSEGFEFMRLAKNVEGLISNYQRLIDGYIDGAPAEKLAQANRALGRQFRRPHHQSGYLRLALEETEQMNEITKVAPDATETPVSIPVEAYISEDYARAERDKLWRKVWLQAGRVEDIPEVGSYITYDILDDSVLIVRTAPDTIKAYHNVCTHRGRRLVDTPAGARNARGNS